MLNFRAPSSPVVHLTSDSQVTLCGKNARLGARWSDADPNVDRRRWRSCTKCRAAFDTTSKV